MACLGKSTNRPSVPFIPEHPPQMLYNPLSIFKSHLSFCPPPSTHTPPQFLFLLPTGTHDPVGLPGRAAMEVESRSQALEKWLEGLTYSPPW